MSCVQRDRRTNRVQLIPLLALLVSAVGSLAAQEQEARAPAREGAVAEPRFPGESWMQYADVSEAGFSPAGLDRARRFFENRDGAAFLAVSHGAVVAAWGDIDRRFLAHSMRKSVLSALYGVFGDEIDLGLTLEQLGIDDLAPLTDQEKQARVVDLLASRSGVYHPAVAEPREMSSSRPERGSHPPGTHWWYNNWDFNAAGTIFRQQTGRDVFEAFEAKLAKPLGMQDYRSIDGWYDAEPEKSLHPAYSLRISTRDLARLGLLYARGGNWRGEQIVPRRWVVDSTSARSDIDVAEEYGSGYGLMWWVDGERGFSARGYGGHVMAVYPHRDLVLVVRADTYHERFLSNRAIDRLFERVLQAGGRERSTDPRLVPLRQDPAGGAGIPELSPEQLARSIGEVELQSGRKVEIGAFEGGLTVNLGSGAFRLMPEDGTRFRMEDTQDPVILDLDESGRVVRVWAEQLAYLEAADAVKVGRPEEAVAAVVAAAERFPESARLQYNVARGLIGTGRSDEALEYLAAALRIDPGYSHAKALRRRVLARRYGWILGVSVLALVLWVGVRWMRRYR